MLTGSQESISVELVDLERSSLTPALMGDPPPDVDTSQPHDSEGLILEEGICNL